MNFCYFYTVSSIHSAVQSSRILFSRFYENFLARRTQLNIISLVQYHRPRALIDLQKENPITAQRKSYRKKMAHESDQIITAESLKESGNRAFKLAKYDTAIDEYSRAIKLASASPDEHRELPAYYKNRAAAHLKLEQWSECIADCTAALAHAPNDPKALFRRAQAYEQTERYEESYKDAVEALRSDPKNKQMQDTLQRLHIIVMQRKEHNSKTANKVQQMCDILVDVGSTEDKRKSAMNNLLVLARDPIGADLIVSHCFVAKISNLLKTEKNPEIYINAIRTIDEVCNKSVERTQSVLQTLGVPWFLQVLDSRSVEVVTVAQHCMQTVLNSFSGMTNKPNSKPDKKLCEEHTKEIDTLLTCLTYSITNSSISGLARDAIMELLTRNVHHTTLSWAERLVEIKGLHRLMDVCSELEEYKYESAMEITPSSRTIAAVCLSRIYENMYYDELRLKFTEQIDDFIKDKLLSPDFEAKVRVTVAITSLLLGTVDVGNAIISREGILSMILVMATTDDVLQQKVACECIIAATSKLDKAKTIINQGVDILKSLYRSKDDGVKVRALVGLCKLGSYGGLDASIRPFADGSTMKLASACRQFLVKPGKQKVFLFYCFY